MNNELILLFARNYVDYTMPNDVDSIKFYNDSADEFLSMLALSPDEYVQRVKGLMDEVIMENSDYLRKHGPMARLGSFATPMVRHLFNEDLSVGKGYFPVALCKKDVLERLVIADWLTSKQVFSVSTELTQALMSCVNDDGGLEFYLQSFDHLPFRSFYVNLENVPTDVNAMGFSSALVGVRRFNAEHAWLYVGFIDKTGKIVHNWAVDFADELIKDGHSVSDVVDLRLYDKRGLPSEKIYYFIMSTILYLTTDKPDVLESSETKHTYREPGAGYKVKNKFREIRKWDVGVRYAASVKETKEYSYQKKDSAKDGTPKRPHVRRAHWHHYWVGRGRTELVLRWVDQMLINASWDSELPVVVHPE